MESAGGGAVLSRRSRTEVRWGDRGDSARLVGQDCGSYSPTPTREDFCQPPPPAPKRQAFWLCLESFGCHSWGWGAAGI